MTVPAKAATATLASSETVGSKPYPGVDAQGLKDIGCRVLETTSSFRSARLNGPKKTSFGCGQVDGRDSGWLVGGNRKHWQGLAHEGVFR